jgi:UDP-N-acetylglucosamine--N-acetylmuramyl-(pentapeptide) pyrophosphoryl-undecaprenol N-acetylglucosamine transferase
VPLTVLIAGGGTGGHLYPGIAVARELMKEPATRVTFVGTASGLESRVLPREGFELDVIRSSGLKGKSLAAFARGVGFLPLSAIDAWQVLSRRHPKVVVGVGGYSSGPVVLLAALRGIPTLLMEQNAIPGLANRLLAPVVRAAAVTYGESAQFFGPKAFVSGNPVRRDFFPREPSRRSRSSDLIRVLVFGGSQGAHALNLAMIDAAHKLAAVTPRVVITHQTGERDLEVVRDGYREAGVEARVEPFLFAMDQEMAVADLAVCRAGATTLAELTAAGLPAILVPLPTATDNHQHRNAVVLARKAAAEIVDQRNLSMLASRVAALAGDPERRHQMTEAARAFARPDAAAVIAARVLDLAGA